MRCQQSRTPGARWQPGRTPPARPRTHSARRRRSPPEPWTLAGSVSTSASACAPRPSPGPTSNASAHAPSSPPSSSSTGHDAASAFGSASAAPVRCWPDRLQASHRATPLHRRRAPRQQDGAGHTVRPADHPPCRRTPLCASAPMRGPPIATHSASASSGAPSSGAACAPVRCPLLMMVPHQSRASRWPRFSEPEGDRQGRRAARRRALRWWRRARSARRCRDECAVATRRLDSLAGLRYGAARRLPRAPVPSSPSTTTPGRPLRPAPRAAAGGASDFSAMASAVRGASISCTRTGKPAAESVPATTSASPPLLPPPA